MKRPVLLLHIKAPSPALKKVAQKHTPAKAIPPSSSAVSTNTTNTKTVKKEETSNINVNKKINATTPAPPQPEEKTASRKFI
jgi:flagellar biosynthesis/type III secretory pathway M-ring protein FliF/YscJ